MKALPFQIPKTEAESFRVQVDQGPHFYDKLHHHPEIQVTAIISGKGTRFIGDKLGNFEPGDILVIGPNVPHLLKCDQEYYEGNPYIEAHSVSLFFKENSLGNDFFSLPELQQVRELIKKSAYGMLIQGEKKEFLFEEIIHLPEKKELDRVISLLNILKIISQEEAQTALSALPFYTSTKEADGNRLNDVIQFAMDNYQNQISLTEISEIAHLSPAAFCRFFKLRTRQTFITFLNEIRIGSACKLLRETEQPISEICYQTGFHNLAHFNRLFKIQTGLTPSQYRKRT